MGLLDFMKKKEPKINKNKVEESTPQENNKEIVPVEDVPSNNTKKGLNPKLKELSNVFERLQEKESRASFYQKTMFILIFAVVVLTGSTTVLALHQTRPVYFAVSPDMKITRLIGLDEPYIQDDGLKIWLTQILNKTLSLDFKNYKEQIMSVRNDFDQKAHDSLLQSMKKNNIFSLIEQAKVISTPVIEKAPVVLLKGLNKGVYSWKLELSFRVDYESSKGIEVTQKLIATVLVERIDTLINPQGVIIKQIILKGA